MIVYFGNQLNHHQAAVWDELYKMTNGNFCFVETVSPSEESKKGSTTDFTKRPYLFQAWIDVEHESAAKKMAVDSDVALFGASSLSYQVLRCKKTSKLSFEVSERWLKKGFINLLSPRLIKNMWYYHTLFYKKPIYKLCSGAFVAGDQYKLFSFKNRCYKWGYFTSVNDSKPELPNTITQKSVSLMWCGRFLDWKHPEFPVILAEMLHKKGYRFLIDMYGKGPKYEKIQLLIKQKGIEDVVKLHGGLSNSDILKEMRQHNIFLFTSDRNEGWGAVLNEAMSSGCAVVASDAIGSVPFLVQDGINGVVFRSGNIDSLCIKVEDLLQHSDRVELMGAAAFETMRDDWSPKNAANRLLELIAALQEGCEPLITSGPCSKAVPIYV